VVRQLVRSWDLASASDTKADPDFSVGLLMGRDPLTDLLYIVDVIRGRWSPAELENKIKATARWDGEETRIRIPQDPGQAGKFQAAYLAGQLRGYSLSSEREEGTRNAVPIPLPRNASMVSSRWSRVNGTRRLSTNSAPSPSGAHDDQVDAASAAFRALMRRVTWHAVAA
jgi:phage terminase large subunit-like protein